MACIRCAKEHPDDAATPLAFLVAPDADGPALLYRASRSITAYDKWPDRYIYSAAKDARPLADRANTPVTMRCRRCRLSIGPISAKKVAALFAAGRDHDGVLPLPPPPDWSTAPVPRRRSVPRG